MLVLTAQMCMAINLYKECRGTSDKECQMINTVVLNRVHQNDSDACSEIFKSGQFSWTRKKPQKLEFASYNDMVKYYNVTEAGQLARAFDNVNTSLANYQEPTNSKSMTYYYDKSLSNNPPKWANRMTVAYKSKHLVFFNA